MKGIYYKTPMDFKSIKEKRNSDLTTINESIKQQILALITNSYGECKFDEEFCSDIWKIDFDLLSNENSIKELITNSLKDSIKKYERRLIAKEVNVNLNSVSSRKNQHIKIKKKVSIQITGIVKESNRPFEYVDEIFIGPISY